jgi:hypothetical protein
MELTEELIAQLKADLKTARAYQDLMGENGAIKKIIKASLEGMLDAELTTPQTNLKQNWDYSKCVSS